MATLFFETTAAAERIFGLPETRRIISDISNDSILISSVYVQNEFRRTFIYDAIVCHSVLVNAYERGDSLSTGLKRLIAFPELQHKPRRFKRAHTILANLAPFENLIDAIKRLENDIRYNLHIFFLTGLDLPLINTVNCKMTADPPVFCPPTTGQTFGTFSMKTVCNQQKKHDCNIVSFWNNNREGLNALVEMDIATDLDQTIKNELMQFKEEAKLILNNCDKHSHGKRCHAILSDVIICLECPSSAQILTSNIKHFSPLCSALSREAPVSFIANK